MILNLIERALSLGCGVSLSQVVASARHLELCRQHEAVFDRFGVGTDEGVALRAGSLTMTRLLNTLPEREAIEQARLVVTTGGINSVDSLYRASVQYLGEAIIAAADECLPEEAKALAEEWKMAEAERQIQIAQRLYWIFRHQKQEAHGDLTMEVIRQKMERHLSDHSQPAHYLPKLYGAWDGKTSLANCVGTSEMLTAFGRRANARTLAVSPTRFSGGELRRVRKIIRSEVAADLETRGLGDADASFAESMAASVWEGHLGDRDNFHVATAFELRDQRWILVDPYDLVWGVFPEVWSVNEIFQTLEKYQLVLPGLSLVGHDQGIVRAALEAKLAEARDLVDRSRRIEAEMNERVRNVMDLVDFIADPERDDLDVFMRYDLMEKGKGDEWDLMAQRLTNSEFRNYVAMTLTLGDETLSLRPMIDPSFLPARIKVWLTAFHATATNLLRNQLQEAGQLIHAACEFALPEYHLALSVLNSLNLDTRLVRDTEFHRFAMENGVDQLTLYNAMPELKSGDTAIGRAAQQTLEALPFLHPLCLQRVHWYSGI